jgi:DNA modification methylase
LSTHDWVTCEETVLDVFAGTGTVLLESIVHHQFKRNCLGVEINPLARLIAKVKTTPGDIAELSNREDLLLRRIRTLQDPIPTPEFRNIDLWFSKKVQRMLSRIRFCIDELENDYCRDFFQVCFSSIIRDVSFADPKIPPPVILRPENFADNPVQKEKAKRIMEKKEKANPLLYFKVAIDKNIKRLKQLNEFAANGRVKAEIIWDDARTLSRGKLTRNGVMDKSRQTRVRAKSIGLVLTSPPYINAQKYLRTTKFELLWLGLMEEKEQASLDKNFIGTERIYSDEYRKLTLIEIPSADHVIKDIFDKDPQRAAIVSRYFCDMRKVIEQVHRVLKDEGRFVLVIGNNTIRGSKVNNQKILSEIAASEGKFEVEMILVDEIRSRGMITKRHESGGLVLDEWVLILKKR